MKKRKNGYTAFGKSRALKRNRKEAEGGRGKKKKKQN